MEAKPTPRKRNRTLTKSVQMTPQIHTQIAAYSVKSGIGIQQVVHDALVRYLTELGDFHE